MVSAHVVAVDDSIVRADVVANGVELFGLTRGETVIHAWVEGQRVSWRVTVVMGAQPVRRALAGPSAATGSHGVIGTSVRPSPRPRVRRTTCCCTISNGRRRTPAKA